MSIVPPRPVPPDPHRTPCMAEKAARSFARCRPDRWCRLANHFESTCRFVWRHHILSIRNARNSIKVSLSQPVKKTIKDREALCYKFVRSSVCNSSLLHSNFALHLSFWYNSVKIDVKNIGHKNRNNGRIVSSAEGPNWIKSINFVDTNNMS